METHLLFLALLPGIIIIIYIFRKDKVEHEPIGLIVKLVIFGMISCIPAMFLEQLITGLVPGLKEGTIVYAVYNAFLVAALCEEVCKFLLLRLGSWRNKNFDYRFDGVVYGVSVAVGFALLENVLYVMDGGLYVALMRGVLAVPLHAFCGVFMGIAYGAAKRYSIEGKTGKATTATFRALYIPFLIHGIYDSLAMIESYVTTFSLLVFVLFMYIVAIKNVNRYSSEDWNASFYRQEHLNLYHPGNSNPAPNNSNPGQYNRNAGAAGRSPGQYNRNPGATNPGPGQYGRNPGPANPGPGQYSRNPGPASPGPGQYSRNPGSASPGPGQYSRNPGPVSPNPGQYNRNTGPVSRNPGPRR